MSRIIRRDPETVLVSPTTTRIPGRIIRTGTEGLRLLGLLLTVRAQSERSHAVMNKFFFANKIRLFANFRRFFAKRGLFFAKWGLLFAKLYVRKSPAFLLNLGHPIAPLHFVCAI